MKHSVPVTWMTGECYWWCWRPRQTRKDLNRPVKGFVGVIGVFKRVFILRAAVVGGIGLIRPLPPLSPAGCGRIFQMDALGSTTTALLLGDGRQLSISNFRVRGLLGDLRASRTARGRWAWE